MPSKLINHTLDNIVQGVTQQYQEGRYETQVEEMVNCIPSLSRGVLRRNPIDTQVSLRDLYNGLPEDPFTYVYDKGIPGEQFLIVIPGDGKWYVYDLDRPSATVWSGTDNYLIVPSSTTARQAIKAITLGDITFIVNATIEVEASSTLNTFSTTKYLDWAFYWIKLTTQVVTAQRTEGTESGSKIEGYTYYLFDGGTKRKVAAVKDTRPNETDPDLITADNIATKMASYEASWYQDGSYVFDKNSKPNWVGEDTNGNTASLAVWKTVDNASELPLNMPVALDGFIVRVTGMADIREDDYYLYYDQPENTWKECAKPGISIGVNPATMPHCLYAFGDTGSRTFEFDTYKLIENNSVLTDSAWQEREVGDLVTNPDPKFVGKTITNIFFFRNRLGFISQDTITMSRVDEYGGLYINSIQVLRDDGPINLFVATTDINILRHAVPTANTLIIFADEAQFVLQSGGQPLTPVTATINVLSRYNYSPLVDAQSYGNSIVFTSQAGGYSQLLEMSVEDTLSANGLQAEAEILTSHIPSYIPSEIQLLATHNVLGYTFLHTNQASNAIYVLTHKKVGGKRVQLAFHQWQFSFNIVGLHVVNNKLAIVTDDGTLAVMALETPGDINEIAYEDHTNVGPTTEPDVSPIEYYTSGIWFSTFYFRDQRGLGSNRGRMQLRTLLYDVQEGSKYMTSITTTIPSVLDTQQNSCYYPFWDDSLNWIDDGRWIDIIPTYTRRYYDDKLITVLADNEKVKIVFSHSDSYENRNKGFELHTVNVESLYYQRSTRT